MASSQVLVAIQVKISTPLPINLLAQPSRWGLFTPQCGPPSRSRSRQKKSWTELLETTINSGTIAIISYMLIGSRQKWSLPMVPKTGTSNRFTSFNMFQALPASIKKHLFYHNGAHVYLNNWQSIDFREHECPSLKNCWATIQAMVANCHLAGTIQEKVGLPLDDFGNQTSQRTFLLGDGEKVIQTAMRQKNMSAMARLIRLS